MHPVFYWELVRSSRRGGRWALRSAYAFMLLLCLLGSFASVRNRTYNSIDVDYRLRPLAVMGSEFYGWFRGTQFLLVVCIAPILAATSMGEEKRQGTLPLLFASSLGATGIVFSKSALAMLRVTELLLTGLPFAALIMLLGGVEPSRVFVDFLLTMSVAFSAVGMGMLGGALGAGPASAIQWTIAGQLVWYSTPFIAVMIRSVGATTPWPVSWMRINAIYPLVPKWFTWLLGPPTQRDAVVCAAILIVVGCACLAIVVVHLARTRGWSEPIHSTFKPSVARTSHEDVWGRPALWRELRRRPLRRVEKILAVLYALIVLAVLSTSFAYWEVSRQAIVRQQWFSDPPSLFILEVATALLLGFVAFPGQALAGAYAFAEERDKNLLDVLRLTSLTHRDLVHAKLSRLLIRGIYLVGLPVLLGPFCVWLGWTTWMGFALAAWLWCTAGLAATTLGTAAGIHLRKLDHAIWFTTGFVLIVGGLTPTAIFLANPTRTTTLYHWAMPIAPALHGSIMLAVEIEGLRGLNGDYVARNDFVDRQYSRNEYRRFAAGWGTVYLLVAVAFYGVALIPPSWRETRSARRRSAQSVEDVKLCGLERKKRVRHAKA